MIIDKGYKLINHSKNCLDNKQGIAMSSMKIDSTNCITSKSSTLKFKAVPIEQPFTTNLPLDDTLTVRKYRAVRSDML